MNSRKAGPAVPIVLAAFLQAVNCNTPRPPAEAAPVSAEHHWPADEHIISGPVKSIERIRQRSTGSRVLLGRLVIDDAYLVYIDTDSRLFNADGMKADFAALEKIAGVEITVRPLSFTTTTKGIPKWAIAADRVVLNSKETLYHELTVKSAVIDRLEHGRLFFRAAGAGGHEQAVQSVRVFSGSRVLRGEQAVLQHDLKAGVKAVLVYGYAGDDYVRYMGAVRNADYADLPEEVYRSLEKSLFRARLQPGK